MVFNNWCLLIFENVNIILCLFGVNLTYQTYPAMSSKKIFRDPIYGLIAFDKEVDKPILDIIKLPEFQRLRRIRQLGLSCYTYPSSVHDRFTHSIGACYITGIFANKIIREENITLNNTQNFSKQNLTLLLKLTALLHDIGHGPFSHVFERITDINHEKLTKYIILRPAIASILENYNISPHLIIEILEGDIRPLWIKELISSQFDIDRMDYLQRDAYMCGVSYSRFDWNWIIENTYILPTEKLAINGKKGIYSIESFVVSRYHMYEQVYFHKTTRGFEGLLIKIFEKVTSFVRDGIFKQENFIDSELFGFLDASIKYQDIQNKENKTQQEEDECFSSLIDYYLSLDDFLIFSQIRVWSKHSDKNLKKLCESFSLRRPFKMVLEERELTYKSMEKIRSIIPQEEFDNNFFMDDFSSSIYKTTHDKDGKVKEAIWIITDDQSPKMLNEVSDLIYNLPQPRKRERLYCHEDYAEIVQNALNK